MTRLKHVPEEHNENHERWLISYADFITLMFAFFVVMYATTVADKDRTRELSQAVQDALSEGNVKKLFKGKAASHSGAGQPLAKLDSPLDELRSTLKTEISKGTVEVQMEGRGLVISLKQAAFFPSGDSTVAPSGYPALEKVAMTLQKIPNPVRLEGHTDSIPISNERFRNNWQLSSARSIVMLELMSRKYGIPESRLAAVGYADTVPVDSNETEEGRARNRRVDITVLNDESFKKEPRGLRP